MNDTLPKTLSVCQLAKYWRVTPQKVRGMVRRGLLTAIDLGGLRPQLRITPEAIKEAEERLRVRPAPPVRRKRLDDGISPTVRALLDADDD